MFEGTKATQFANRIAGCAVAAIATAGLLASPVSAQNNTQYVSVNSGTTVPIVLDSPSQLSSTSSHPGERFTAHVVNPNNNGYNNGNNNNGGYNNGGYNNGGYNNGNNGGYNNGNNNNGGYNNNGNYNNSYNNSLPDGTRVYGHVTAAVRKYNNQTGFLGLAFDKIVLPNGTSYNVQAVPATVSNGNVDVRSDGSVVAKSNSTATAGRDAAIGAAAGAVGDILFNHGSINLSHILLGGAAGYGVSTINKSQNSSQDVKISQGNTLGMRFTRSINSGNGY